MISFIIDHLPWWAYWAAIGFVALATLPMWWPVAVTIWTWMPNWMKALVIGIGAILTAYAAGRNRGSKNERDRQAERSKNAEAHRDELHKEIEALPDSELDKRFNRWVR